MKRAVIFMAAIGLMTGLATGVVGHNNSSGSDLGITSGGSAGATTGVNENGTQYTAKVEMTGRNSSQTGNQVRDTNYDSHQKVEFNGTITAGTPCHVIDHELNKTGGDSYTLDIQTKRDEIDDQACAEAITGINYRAEFEADSGFQLEIQHDSKKVETLEDRVVEKEPEPTLIQRLLNFIGL